MIDNNNYFIITILCLQTLYNCALSVVGQYIYQFFLQTYPDNRPQNWTNISFSTIDTYELTQDICTKNTTDISNNSAQIWAQQRSADLIFQITLWRAFPVIIITYLFGLHASRLNRRLILFVSLLGNTIHVVIYQAIIYKHLAIYWWYISAFIAGLAGGTNVLGIINSLIITESTEENERSSYFVRLTGLGTALAALATFGIGYYIQYRGFTDLFWLAIGLEIASIFAVIFLLKKPSVHSSPSIDETTSLLSATNANVEIRTSVTSNCFDICTIFSFKHRSRQKNINLILTIVSYVFHLLAVSSLSPLLWYLLGAPFCWSSTDLGNFSAISLISTAIFSVIGMKLLNYYGANDALICALGHICLLGYSLSIALAKYSWQLYLALLIYPFSGYQSTLTVSMVSKWLEVHERSNAFTLVTEINTIILAFGSSFFNWFYARTVIYQKNMTLLIAAGLCIVPFLLNICLFIMTRRTSREEEEDEPRVISDLDVKPITLSLSNNPPPQDVDVTSSILLFPSCIDSLSLSHNDRSVHASFQSSIDDHSVIS